MLANSLFFNELVEAPRGRQYTKRIKPPPLPKPINLSQFSQPDTGAVYIGQNVYIKPSYIVSMPEFHFFSRSSGEYGIGNPRYMTAGFQENKKNLLNNRHNGTLSKKALSNIRGAINWLCLSAKKKRVFNKATNSAFQFKVGFITLTLPDTHKPVTSGVFTKNLLNPFLVYLRKYHQLANYVWKIEYQENGKLHCHITIDTFIHWRDVRKRWNSLLNRNGFLDKFFEDFGHRDPNSTDVHSTKKIKNLAGYLAKYMSKNTNINANHKGRIWGCNYELSAAKKCQVHIPADEAAQQMKTLVSSKLEFKKLLRLNPITGAQKSVGEIFFPTTLDWAKSITGKIKETFEQTRRDIQSIARHFSYYELQI